MTDLPTAPDKCRPLMAYLLGSLGHAEAEILCRRLVYDVSGGGPSAVVLFEPTPGITIGRDGSRAHVRATPPELNRLGWPVRWVSRGGGTLLHLPGQVACYPIVRLDELDLTPAGYVRQLAEIAAELCGSFGLKPEIDPDRPGVRSRGRRVASVAAAARCGVTAFGLYVNSAPDLDPFRQVDCDGDSVPMTSLTREAPAPVRPQAVRQRLVDLIAGRLGFGRVSVFHQHPMFLPKPTRHALAPGHR